MTDTSTHAPFWSATRWFDKLSILLFFAVWELAPRAGGLFETFIAPPSVLVKTLAELLQSGELYGHIGISLGRAAAGFAVAGAIAIPLGFLLGGGFRTFERLINLPLRFLSQVNPFSLFPLFILLFGIGELSKGAMIFWVCLWPILFNTVTGVKGIDPLLVKSARSMGTGPAPLFFKVILPAAAPGIFTGLRLAAGYAFIMSIAAEMMGASSVLGWLVNKYQESYHVTRIFAGATVITFLAASTDCLLRLQEKRVVVWNAAGSEGSLALDAAVRGN
jgi:NitT/TauT family transport system permease protein